MVDTSLRRRPAFGTFLQSDSNAGGDGITYYEYQRYLRAQKVALLQEKRANAHIPGYKKTTSRKVVQLNTANPTHFAATANAKCPESTPELAIEEQTTICIGPSDHKTAPSSRASVTGELSTTKHPETERLPKISAYRHRSIKSATARNHRVTWPGSELYHHTPRPSTVAGVRDAEKIIHEGEDAQRQVNTEYEEEQTKPVCPVVKKHAWSESDQMDDLENQEQNKTEIEILASAFTWGTTTQRAYNEVGWAERMVAPVQPPANTIEHFPDPVSQKLTFRRYHSEPARWQTCGLEWDCVQTRGGSFLKGPLAVNYCTSAKHTQQIPGYLGCVPDHENLDNPLEEFNPPLLIRSLKPRHTNVSRRINIPGYTGHVHSTGTSRTETKTDLWCSTNKRSHRPIPREEDISPFCRNGIFSKMITTVSPHNPFNKIEL